MSNSSNIVELASMRILSKRLILIKCPGLDTEIFMLQIIKGRLTLQNIIPSRSCCKIVADDYNISKGKDKEAISMRTSTPLLARRISFGKATTIIEKENYEQVKRTTPERMRSENNTFRDQPLTPLENGINRSDVVTPSVIQQSFELDFDKSKQSILEGSLIETNRSDFWTPLTPNESYRSTILNDSHTFWRKVLTPIRTYSRRNPCLSIPSMSNISEQTFHREKHGNPTTMPPKTTLKIEIRKRKIIIDRKKSLSKHRIEKPIVHKKMILEKTVAAKNRKQYEAIKLTAFDMLTSSNRRHIANALQEQFRKGCINKASSTHPSFKVLATVPPLLVKKNSEMCQETH